MLVVQIVPKVFRMDEALRVCQMAEALGVCQMAEALGAAEALGVCWMTEGWLMIVVLWMTPKMTGALGE